MHKMRKENAQRKVLSRRSFLGLAGKAAFLAPLLAFAPVAVLTTPTHAQLLDLGTPDIRPLVEAGITPPRLVVTTDPVYQKPLDVFVQTEWFAEAPGHPTIHDPLGQMGFLAVKFKIDGKTYGDYIKITDMNTSDYSMVLPVAKESLWQHVQQKAQMIKPGVILHPGNISAI